MKLELKSFRSKVALRIFMLFIICAIVPISAMALVSFVHVRNQLNIQSKELLRMESKAMSVSVYERLLLLEADMRLVSSNLTPCLEKPMPDISKTFAKNLRNRFKEMAIISGQGSHRQLFGSLQVSGELTASEKQYIYSGNAFLYVQEKPGSTPQIFMYMSLDPKDSKLGILIGEINQSYLWEVAEGRSSIVELCVLDKSNNILFNSLPYQVSFPNQVKMKISHTHSGEFEWNHKTKEYFTYYRTVFLKPNFYCPGWTVVLSMSKKDLFSPQASFTKSFPFIILLSIGIVFFLSNILIKKNMLPIVILEEATFKIAHGDFDHMVEIKSGDEFESLGHSFNEMAGKLQEGQDLLVRAAKLSTMGQMSAGIIHEIKQPLTAISLNLQMSMMKESSDEYRKYIKRALNAVDGLNVILERFKSFSYISEGTMKSVSIVEIIDNLSKLFGHQFNQGQINCIIENEKNLPYILGDKQGLQQVFSNLLINAMHALEDKQDGRRTINIKTYLSRDKVVVEIEDNGLGIPKEIQNRIFEPFFTTKSAEKGTGLGMAIIESILHKHSAGIEFESEVGVGTKFIITFPSLSQTEGINKKNARRTFS
ncbi:MAG TPA: hypothetical protein DDW42_02650 [Desulfobacteraceae bacterium]|nr:hypothetical protein [Desulfobacteraceae bacterium]